MNLKVVISTLHSMRSILISCGWSLELDLMLGIYISIHEVVANMDAGICATLPMFHVFTGYNTVSAFCGRGKKTAWNTWNVYLEIIKTFEEFC